MSSAFQAGGALAQLLALGFPDRVLSLVLISTSPAKRIGRSLPSPTERYREFLASAEVDWSDQASVIDYLTSMGACSRGVSAASTGPYYANSSAAMSSWRET